MAVRTENVLGQEATAANTFTFSCDPVLGYVVTGEYRLTSRASLTTTKKGKATPLTVLEFTNYMEAGMDDPWPWNHPYERTVYGPDERPGRYVGWANNWVSADLSDNAELHQRNGGFTAFVNEDPTKGRWAAALTRIGTTPFTLATCNVWQDMHQQVALNGTPGPDGMIHTDVTFRMLHLPPELTTYINARTDLMTYNGKTAVMPRLGALDDFEDQPLPLTTTVRGIRVDGLQISEAQAHSGTRSAMLAGSKAPGREVFSTAPQIPTEVDTRYRIEAWVFVEGAGTTADITADLYRASPHYPERATRQQTNTAAAGQGWTLLALDFATAGLGYDPFVDLRFRVMGPGKAYFDDFGFVKVKGE